MHSSSFIVVVAFTFTVAASFLESSFVALVLRSYYSTTSSYPTHKIIVAIPCMATTTNNSYLAIIGIADFVAYLHLMTGNFPNSYRSCFNLRTLVVDSNLGCSSMTRLTYVCGTFQYLVL